MPVAEVKVAWHWVETAKDKAWELSVGDNALRVEREDSWQYIAYANGLRLSDEPMRTHTQAMVICADYLEQDDVLHDVKGRGYRWTVGYAVKSQSTKAKRYRVNADKTACTCPAYIYGRKPCKHIKVVESAGL